MTQSTVVILSLYDLIFQYLSVLFLLVLFFTFFSGFQAGKLPLFVRIVQNKYANPKYQQNGAPFRGTHYSLKVLEEFWLCSHYHVEMTQIRFFGGVFGFNVTQT